MDAYRYHRVLRANGYPLFIYALMLWATPAGACHRYSTWHYPYPQRCYTALAHIPKLTKQIHIPAVLPPSPPAEEDLYPPEAVYKLKQELNELQIQRR